MTTTETKLMIEVGGTLVPAAVSMPSGTTPRRGVVLVPGSFNNDLDGNYAHADGNPFEIRPNILLDLARQLAGLGHAVLRYAKAGTKIIDEEKAVALRSFAGRSVVAAAACAELRRFVPGLDRLAVAGHSEGAAVSLALLTSKPDTAVDAFISLSGPGMRFFDVMVAQSEPNARNGIVSFAGFSFPLEFYRRSFDYIRAGQPVPEEIRAVLPPFGVHAMPPEARRYLVDYDKLDPCRAISGLPQPVLIVQGGQDTSVIPENAERLAAARRGKEGATTRADFPGLNHFYKSVPPGTPPTAIFALEGETDGGVAAAIDGWLRGLVS